MIILNFKISYMTYSPHHDHKKCIESAIWQAEQICIQRGVKLTPLRKAVLHLIWQSHKAVKAYELLEQLKDYSSKPPTIYRALDFLIQQGLVHKVESLNAFIGCPHPQHVHTLELFICKSCGDIVEITDITIQNHIAALAQQQQFIIDKSIVEIHGFCQNCKN